MSAAPTTSDVEAIVGTRTHAGRVYPIRRLRHQLDCSCGASLGTTLDYIVLFGLDFAFWNLVPFKRSDGARIFKCGTVHP